ncbi:MAG: acyl-CoA dehydrogenase family protein [Ardenticatenaceae bacterium]|nr:acyl-CoA dehydrogenase family protein [Ardenticatenaceae bacterium]
MIDNSPPAARARLAAWEAARPANFFEADPALQRALRLYLGDARFAALRPRLSAAGHAAATIVDEAARLNDRPENHPRLERWSGTGERIEQIEFHPSYHAAGRPLYESGVLALQAEPGHALEQAALLYLFGHCGEMGHLCPAVCTAGLIRALQAKGSPALQARYLPPLLDPSYDRRQTGAQFLTEVQGGSDVGANVVRATPVPGQPGVWRINGEKWFCSNATAEQILITARPDGAPEGTRGLGLFLMPRSLPDGRLNGIELRRLKTKFGTRTMASAEMDFHDALAYQVGAVEEGIHIVLESVINTSRWLNAIGSLGALRRAEIEARAFAAHRVAFGHPIIEYPLVQEALAEIAADLAGGLAVTWRLSHLVDRQDLGQASRQERAVFRLLVNLNKYRTSIASSLGIRRAQEIFGGNGAIEDFSIIPRLYRDAVVYESWEGSHNVLCVQALRDMSRYRLDESLLASLRADLDRVTAPPLAALAQELLTCLETTEVRLGRVLSADSAYGQAHVRRVLGELAAVVEATYLVAEADGALARDLPPVAPDLLTVFFNRHLRPDYDPLADPDYLPRLDRLARG